MALICDCPLGVLPSQIDNTCANDMDQVVKIAFQKPQSTAPFVTADPITDLDSWTTLLASLTATKVVLSPAVANLVINGSEGAFIGENSNESVNGLGYYLGENNVRITGEFHSISQEIADELAKLSCFSDVTLGQSNLTAYLFLKRTKGVSRVSAKSTGVAGSYEGFEIFNFRISSLDNQGYQTKTKYMFSFDIQPDEWIGKEDVAVAFNPLALANV